MNRGWLAIGILVIVLAVFSPAWAHAAKEHPPEGDKTEKQKEHKDDFFKGIVDLSIWTIVVFLVLLFVLGKFAWPMMMEGLEKREKAVASALEKAQHAQMEAERLKSELDLEYKQAHDKIRAMMDEARKAAQQNKEEMVAAGKAEIKEEKDRARRELETAHDQALQDLWKQSSQLATLISAKAIRRQLSEDDHRRLVDEALAELKQAANDRQQGLAGLS
jgi:F-type H+-transporting ATPase subunit b